MKQIFIDPYCYPGTSVLRNHLDIRDSVALTVAEERVVALCADRAFADPVKPPHDLSKLLSVHSKLFGKLYPFAGKLREHTGRMTKTRPSGSTVLYCDSAYVPEQLAFVLKQLAGENYLEGLTSEAFAARAAHFYGEMDAVHPFREGNSRTLRLFFWGLAQSAGFRLDWAALAAREGGRDELYAARDRAVMHGDSAALSKLFAAILSPILPSR